MPVSGLNGGINKSQTLDLSDSLRWREICERSGGRNGHLGRNSKNGILRENYISLWKAKEPLQCWRRLFLPLEGAMLVIDQEP